VLAAIESGDAGQAREALRTLASTADKAAASHKIHRNKAARIKSRLSARIVAASKGGAAASAAKGSSARAGGKSKKAAAKPKA
jgi:small subunit ribosomal protein S20